MGPPYLLGFSRVGPAGKKFTFWPYNKSFIDPACSVKRAELRPNPFWRFYRPRSIKTQKKRLGRYSAIVTSRLINNAYVGPCKGIRIPESGKFSLLESRILGPGIQNPTNDWNPVPRIPNQFTAWNRHNSRLLGFPYMGRHRHV